MDMVVSPIMRDHQYGHQLFNNKINATTLALMKRDKVKDKTREFGGPIDDEDPYKT